MQTYKLSLAIPEKKGLRHSTRKITAPSLCDAIAQVLKQLPTARIIKGRKYTPIHEIL